MARFDTNRSAEMEVLVRVVDLGGFTQAARKLRLTPSGVSKLISRLEARLGSRLINRTTRKLTLTEEGQAFYQRALRILGELQLACGAVDEPRTEPGLEPRDQLADARGRQAQALRRGAEAAKIDDADENLHLGGAVGVETGHVEFTSQMIGLRTP